VDADAAFLKKPSFTRFLDYDFSVRVHDFLPDNHSSKVVSNSIFVNYTEEGLEIVRQWCERCEKEMGKKKKKGEFWDQMALRDVLQLQKTAKFFPMPVGYSKIFDLDIFFIGNEEVVIEHYQASRRLKVLV
jgi:hypothetical protein